MQIVPCAEGDDKLIAEKLDAIIDSMITFDNPAEGELVVFKVTDSDGAIIAGSNLIIGCWKVADIDILWVEEKYRRQGIGSSLVRTAERTARERGCHMMTLGTFDFQAKPLYEKHGYTECGTIKDCSTKGHMHYDMIKWLNRPFTEFVSPVPSPYEIRLSCEEDVEFIDDRLVEYNLSKIPSMHDFVQIGKRCRVMMVNW